MRAFHTLWTAPERGDKPYQMDDFSLLTMVLSAKKWREQNGEIYLFTDREGRKYLTQRGLLDVWNKIYPLDIQDISADTFWAAGKIFALSRLKPPIVSIDTDFIVWKKIDFGKISQKLCVIHKEELNQDVYPVNDELMKFDRGYSWDVLPSNTAFVYYNDNEFIKEYTSAAIEIMKSLDMKDNLIPMVFAEQRLFSMIGDKMNIEIGEFSKLDRLFSNENKTFTHLWGAKSELRKNKKMRDELCKRLRNRIEEVKI